MIRPRETRICSVYRERTCSTTTNHRFQCVLKNFSLFVRNHLQFSLRHERAEFQFATDSRFLIVDQSICVQTREEEKRKEKKEKKKVESTWFGEPRSCKVHCAPMGESRAPNREKFHAALYASAQSSTCSYESATSTGAEPSYQDVTHKLRLRIV